VAGLPYFLSLGAAESEGGSFLSEHLHFGFKNLVTILMPLIVLYYPAMRLVRRISGKSNRKYILLYSWIIPLLALNIFADLPLRGESKLIFPLFLLLGPVVGTEIFDVLQRASGRRKKLLLSFFFILFFIPPFLTFSAFLTATPGEDADELINKEIMRIRYQTYRSDRTIFEMIERKTGRDAVVMEKDMKHLVPVFASRRNLAAGLKFHRVYGYDRDLISTRYRVNHNIFSGEPLSEETIDFLQGTGFDLYFLLERDAVEENGCIVNNFELNPDLFRLVFSIDRGRLYALRKGSQ
jgi:hypothetical protein